MRSQTIVSIAMGKIQHVYLKNSKRIEPELAQALLNLFLKNILCKINNIKRIFIIHI